MKGSGILILSCFAPFWLLLARLNNAPMPWLIIALGSFLSVVLIWLSRKQEDPPSNQSAAEQKRIGRVFMWSSIGEGVGIFIAINVLINMHMADRVMAGIALVVGLHFIPIGLKVPMRVALLLATVMLVISVAGFSIPSAEYAALFVGCAGAATLWTAVIAAITASKRRSPTA